MQNISNIFMFLTANTLLCVLILNFWFHAILYSYYLSGDEKALEECKEEVSICQRKINEDSQKRNDLQTKINQFREQLANANVNKFHTASYVA